jgi:hypothetical protein
MASRSVPALATKRKAAASPIAMPNAVAFFPDLAHKKGYQHRYESSAYELPQHVSKSGSGVVVD